jgi:hypothetical protein
LKTAVLPLRPLPLAAFGVISPDLRRNRREGRRTGRAGRHDPDRSAVRDGHHAGEVTLGGRRVGVEAPPVEYERRFEMIATPNALLTNTET